MEEEVTPLERARGNIEGSASYKDRVFDIVSQQSPGDIKASDEIENNPEKKAELVEKMDNTPSGNMDEFSTPEKIFMLGLPLGLTALGGLIGGETGAMIGAAEGLKGVGGYFKGKEDEARKIREEKRERANALADIDLSVFKNVRTKQALQDAGLASPPLSFQDRLDLAAAQGGIQTQVRDAQLRQSQKIKEEQELKELEQSLPVNTMIIPGKRPVPGDVKYIKDQNEVAQKAQRLIARLRTNFKKVGPIDSFDKFPTQLQTEIKSDLNQLLTTQNKIAGLGALAGQDLNILLGQVGDPFNFWKTMQRLYPGNSVSDQIDAAFNGLNAAINDAVDYTHVNRGLVRNPQIKTLKDGRRFLRLPKAGPGGKDLWRPLQ